MERLMIGISTALAVTVHRKMRLASPS